MVYGVFGGEYSNWNVEGYFNSRTDAEKYCAARFNMGLYVKEIPKINADVSKVVLKHYHEVVFDIGKGMRNEPTRYDCFTGKDRHTSIRHNVTNKWGWVAISVMAKSRNQAEKIAQDIYTKFLNYYIETGSYDKAAKMIGSTGLK